MTENKNKTRSGQDFDIKRPRRRPEPQFPAMGAALGNYRTPDQPLDKIDHKDFTPPSGDQRKWRSRLPNKRTVKRTILALVILLVLVGGWVGFKFIYNAHKIFGGSVFSAFTTQKLKGEDQGRVNILLAGNSSDDVGHDGADLTDSIMILSIDTKNNSAFMLSVPRDLYVNIPGAGYQKINDAYPVGESDHFSESGYPSGGMGLLEKIINQNFGIQANYYALVDYSALRDAVNTVGGVNITIHSDDPRGLYDPSIDYATRGPLVKLTNGQHTLNGEQALDLARARGDNSRAYGYAASDFTRTANQRLLILALRQKATSAGVLANPIKLGILFDTIGAHTKTDFKLAEVHRLYDVTKNIPGGSIASVGLNNANGKNLLMNYSTRNAGDALVPAAGLNDYGDIQAYINQITSSNPVTREGASVVVLNGTYQLGPCG